METLESARKAGLTEGIAMSIAFMLRNGNETEAHEWWSACGLSIAELVEIGVEEYDLEPIREAGYDADRDALCCPVCTAVFSRNDLCATDIELGVCHAACLDGSPTVSLDTGEPLAGPITPFRYHEIDPINPQGSVPATIAAREG